MDYYFAPLEGITNHIFRRVHRKYFPGIRKYFAPFISPNQSKKVMTKEMRDLLPENNEGLYLVPQILTNQAGDFITTAKKLKQLGYNEINLNLGCPSGTVASKNKGAGFLAFPELLDSFLDEIFSGPDMKISVKTRLGRDDGDEFYRLLDIYNKYPMEELIIHPRIREDFYKFHPRMEYFDYAVKHSKNVLCYNGDLFTGGECRDFSKKYPRIQRIMLGRGLLMDPALVWELNVCEEGKEGVGLCTGAPSPDVRARVIAFHNELYDTYRQAMSGDRNVLFKMKEIWSYLICYFPGNEKPMKKIKKAMHLPDYEAAVRQIFNGS